MEGNSYAQKAYKEIYFSNSDVSFDFFYKNMEQVLKDLITEINLYTINKKIFSFIGNFLHAVNTEEKKKEIQAELLQISKELETDVELRKLIKYDDRNINVQVPYLHVFYGYFIKETKLLSKFLLSLDRTYMPTTDISKSLFKWKNYLQFFNSYISLKQDVTNNLSSFSLVSFQSPINSVLVFYYAYNQYITIGGRTKIEGCLDKILTFISDIEFLKLITKEHKTRNDLEIIEGVKWRMNHILLEIYNRINMEHSIYNIIPKVQKKIYIDSTNI